MDEHELGRLLGVALVPIFWGVTLGLALWLVRRLIPKAEFILFGNITAVIRHLAARVRQARQAPDQTAIEAPDQQGQRPAARD
jgi:hypothetical protein